MEPAEKLVLSSVDGPIRLSSANTKFIRAGFTYGVPVFIVLPIIFMYVGKNTPPVSIPLLWLSFGAIGYYFFVLRIHAQLCDVEVSGKEVNITDAKGILHTKIKSRLTLHRLMFSKVYYLKDTKDRKFWFVTTIHPWDMWDMDTMVNAAMRKE